MNRQQKHHCTFAELEEALALNYVNKKLEESKKTGKEPEFNPLEFKELLEKYLEEHQKEFLSLN